VGRNGAAVTAFRYRAARLDGETVSGSVEAGSPAAALALVASRGLFMLELNAAPADGRGTRAAAASELGPALAGLAALLDAGLPADRALAAVAETASPRLRAALDAAGEHVRQGAALSDALASSGAVPALVVGYLRAGERRGRATGALERAAADLERRAETAARVRAALTYPAFLAVAGTVSVAVIGGFVVPRFAALLGEQGRALPASTRLLLGVSSLLRQWGLPALVALTAGGVALARWLATPPGQRALHAWLLEQPVVGALRLRFATARVCAALSGLLEGGVPMLAALDLAAQAGGDRAVAERVAAARAEVERGERLAPALRRHAALSAGALRLVAFGERSGRLPLFLAHAARLEESAAQRAVQRLVTLLEPGLMIGFAAIVAFVAAALLQAVYSVRPAGF